MNIVLTHPSQLLMVPADMTLNEAMDLVAFVSTGLALELAKRRATTSLVIASGPLSRHS